MLKYIALLFNTIALLVYHFFFADGITVTQNLPKSVAAGSEFTVELTINKGSTIGFAKLQQDLPEGFTAVEEKNAGATFTFSDRSVKFVWMALPNESEIKVSYKIKVAAEVNGDQIMGGKFAYVADNVKQSVDVAPSTITITGGSGATAASSQAVATNTPAATDPPAVVKESYPLSCVRKVPANIGSDFTVQVTINKGNLSGFAKLIEVVPAGFTATAVESRGASFTFTDQKVKFVWISMPADAEYTVSYKVSIAVGTPDNQPIDGTFSYIENDETKKFVLPTSTITMGGGAAATPVVTNTDNSTNTVNGVPIGGVPEKTVAKQEPALNTEKPVVTNNTTSTTATAKTSASTKNTVNTEKSLSATNIPAANGSVNYSVQIAALHNAKSADVLASILHVSETINTEMGEGYTKYTVGTHNEYKSARDARENIRNQGVTNPWVTAYNGGKRITVQEALMITNQKWYK